MPKRQDAEVPFDAPDVGRAEADNYTRAGAPTQPKADTESDSKE